MNISTANKQLLNVVNVCALKLTTKNIFFGIYAIYNTTNQKIYIGKTIHLYGRIKQHINNLNKKTHRSRHLQYSWNKYKKYSFIFYLIEQIDKEELLNDREQFYISLCESNKGLYGYNSTNGGEGSVGFKHTEKSKKLLSDSAKERFKIKENCPRYNTKVSNESKKLISNTKRQKSKKIVQLNLNGEYINSWNSVMDAIDTLSFLKLTDVGNMYECCYKQKQTCNCKGFLWFFEDDYNSNDFQIPELTRKITEINKIIQCDLNNNIIRTWNNCAEVNKESNGVFVASSVLRFCKRENNIYKNYKWFFEKDFKLTIK